MSNFNPTLIIISLFSIVVGIFAFFTPKIKMAVDNKIIVLAFTFMAGIMLVFFSSYPLNVMLVALLVSAFIPIVLLHNTLVSITYTALVVIAFIINVLMGHSELKTLEGTMQVSLALETKITITAVLMIALVIAFFIRRSIKNIFDNLVVTVEDQIKTTNEINASRAVIVSGVAEYENSFRGLSDAIITLNTTSRSKPIYSL